MKAINLIARLARAEKRYSSALNACFDQAPAMFRKARKRFGWSQRELARLLECDHTYISKIENGRVKPGRPVLKKLSALIKTESED